MSAVAVDVLLPRLSDAMTGGTLLAWLVADGAAVAVGDPLVEIETDKATVVHEAEAEGVLEIVVGEGESAAVGDLIARIGPAGRATPAPAPAPVEAREPEPEPAPAPPAGNGHRPAAHVAASPLARTMAARHGIALAELEGNGPGGMVLRADVMRAARLPDSPPARRPAAGPAATPEGRLGEVSVVEPSRIQRIVAERMSESRATIPDFTMRVDVDMDEAVALRARLREAVPDGPAPSVNDMVVRSCALALRDLPTANAAMRDGRLERYSRVNIGIAVAADGALMVPVILDADRRTLGDIAGEARRLAGAVRDGSIAPADLDGATFTVSNLGMYGMRSFTAIISPPQAAILAVGAVREEPVARDGQVRVGSVMSLTLSGDHRVMNGVDGAELLGAIALRLEQPVRLLL